MADTMPSTNFFTTANEGFVTTLGSSILSGATTIPLTSVSGLTNGTIFAGIIEPSLTKQQVFTGVVDTSGVQLTSVVWVRGSNADHSAGVTIVDYVTGASHNMMTTGILKQHTQAGAHGAITATSMASTGAVSGTTGTFTGVVNASTVSSLQDTSIALSTYRKETQTAFVASGLVITADSVGVNKNYSMTAGVVYINGRRISINAVSAQTVAASKDRYIDILDNADGTGTIVNTEVTNNTASPALAANSIRIGIVVAGATTIAATGSINQGEQTRVLPIIASVALSVSDSLGNLIGNRNPNPTNIGYAQIITSATTGSATDAYVTGLASFVSIPAGRKYRVTAFGPKIASGGTTNPTIALGVYSGASNGTLTTLLEEATWTNASATANFGSQVIAQVDLPPLSYTTATTTAISASFRTSNGTLTLDAAGTKPAYVKVDLI